MIRDYKLVYLFCTAILISMAILSVHGILAYCLEALPLGASSLIETAAVGFIALSSSAVVYAAMTAYLVATITGPVEILARQDPLVAQAITIALTFQIALLAHQLFRTTVRIGFNANLARVLADFFCPIAHLKRACIFQSPDIISFRWVPGSNPPIVYH